MQHAFSLVERWCGSNELAINPTKVDLALFTNKRKYDLRLPHLSGYPVQISKTVKNLGVTFDSKLNWFAHVDCTVKKANAILGECRSAVRQNWGFSPKIMFWIFRTIVRPMPSPHDYRWNELNKFYDSSVPDRTASVRSPYKGTAAGACYRLKAFKKWQGGQGHVSAKLLREASVFSSFPSHLGLHFQT